MSGDHALSTHPDGAVLTVWVVPGASRTEIVGWHGDALRIRVAAPPEKGKANRAIVDLLAEKLGGRVELKSGTGSRRKRVLIRGVGLATVRERLDRLTD